MIVIEPRPVGASGRPPAAEAARSHTNVEISLEGCGVMIGIPCYGAMPVETVTSLLETAIALKGRIDFEVKVVSGGSIVEKARSLVTHAFLSTKLTHLFMIDADMRWSPPDFVRLLCLATKMDVVGATYPAKVDGKATFLLRGPIPERIATNEWGCLPVRGIGLGFTVVARRVIEALAENAPKLIFAGHDEPVAHMFGCRAESGSFVGEDMAFFSDCKAAGFQPWLDPAVDLGHVGQKIYTGSIRNALMPA